MAYRYSCVRVLGGHFVRAALRFQWLAVALTLGACANVQLVDRYDVAIEDGVNKYHKDVTKFLKDNVAYTSPQAKQFYSTAAADLANVIVRAQVVAVKTSCDDGKFAEAIAAAARNGAAAAGLPDPGTADVSLQDGSCTVVTLKVLQANHARLEAVHKRNGTLGPFRAALWTELMNSSVRIALTTEAANKI
jgi:hypothetical protein